MTAPTSPPAARPSHLHVVESREAQVLALRAEAFDRFERRYRHNPGSQQTMVRALEAFARLSSNGDCQAVNYPWELLTDDLIVEELWRDVIGHRARNTALKWATAIRVMLSCCRRVGLLTHDELLHASAFETTDGGKVLKPAGRYLSEESVNALLDACRNGRTGGAAVRIRDHALVAVLASSAVRSVEITGLEVDNFVLDEHRLDLTITKGSRPREAWLHPVAIEALEAWLAIRGRAPGPLFVPLSRTGRPMVDRGSLSYHQVWRVVRRRAAEAELGVVTPHDLRRFVITTLLANGHDLLLVCRIAGHVRPETTAAYDRRPAEAQRAAIESLSLRAFQKSRRRDLED